jgi:methionyl-tRNA formyltransferase
MGLGFVYSTTDAGQKQRVKESQEYYCAKMHRMTRVVFMGSPEFAVPILRALADGSEVVGVVTRPNRPAGRGRAPRPPAVKAAANELSLPSIQPEKLNSPEALATLQNWSPDVIVVAAFGQILRKSVLNLPQGGCLNVHASLLPRWRGAAPIQAAILAGDGETGITIVQMDEGLDTGAVISQRRLPIEAGDTGGSLTAKLADLGAALLVETLPRYLGGELVPVPQPGDGVTQAPLLRKSDGLLNFDAAPEVLGRRVRAYNPWPGAYFQWRGGQFRVHEAHPECGEASPGQHLVRDGKPAVGAAGGILVLDRVQPAGKREMEGGVFLMGARDWTA